MKRELDTYPAVPIAVAAISAAQKKSPAEAGLSEA
jgi:hypothetical protein